CPSANGEASAELARRQLLEPMEDGRWAVHETVRAMVLAHLSAAERRALELAAAALFEEGADAVDGTPGDVVLRLRGAVRHLAAGGKTRAAAERLLAAEVHVTRMGAAGEALA